MGEFRDEQQREVLVQRLGVFELRGLAREMGIPSPTTKKRDELISLILQSFEKGVTQEVKVQKRGRPYKKLNSLDEIVGSVIDDNKGELSYESVIAFAQEEAPILTVVGETLRLEGVSRVSGANVTIRLLNGNGTIFVGDIYGAEKLENGDIVEVTAQRISDNNDYQALSISLINGQSAISYNRKDVELGEEVISNQVFACGKHQLTVGRRNAILLNEDLYENGNMQQINEYCNQNGIKLVVLGINTSYENQIMLKGLNIKYNFSTPYGTNSKVNLNKTIDGLNVATNLLVNGENVLVVVTDLGGLLLGLDENFDKAGEEHSKETQLIAKKLLSLAAAYKSGIGLTLAMFYNEIDSNDKFLTTDLLRICKKF